MEKLNLVEILKNCPQGTILYSPLFGRVIFQKILLDGNVYAIEATTVRTEVGISFTADGRYYESEPEGECVLFPSKDCRDWRQWAKFLVKSKDYVVIKQGRIIKDVDCIYHLSGDDGSISIVKADSGIIRSYSDSIARWASKAEIDFINRHFKPIEVSEKINEEIGRGALVIARKKGGKWELTNFAYYDKKAVNPFVGLIGYHYVEVVPFQGNEDILGTMNEPHKRFNTPSKV